MRPPMLDPKRDLAGATPETLARALFRPKHRPPVASEELPDDDSPTSQESQPRAPESSLSVRGG